MKIRSADPPPRSGTGNQETSFRRCYLAVEPRALYARFPPRFSGHTLRSAWPSALRSEPRTLSINGRQLMVNVLAALVPPPGVRLTTVTAAVPAVLMSVAGTVAVSVVLLTWVVASFTPFHSMTEPTTKLVPVAVRVKAAPPCVGELGEIEVSVGTGLSTTKLEFPDVPPPGAGLLTVTANVPPFAISVARMVAVSSVALTKVVARADPAHFTTEVLTKFLPVTVIVNPAPPAFAVLGESEVIAGMGLSMTSWTVWVPAPSLIVKVAVCAPATVGLAVTVIVQSWPGRRLVPQLLVLVKSPGSVPPRVRLVIARAELWLLVRMMVSALLAPTFTGPKLTSSGETLTGCVLLNMMEIKPGTKFPVFISATSGMPSPLKSAIAALSAPRPL